MTGSGHIPNLNFNNVYHEREKVTRWFLYDISDLVLDEIKDFILKSPEAALRKTKIWFEDSEKTISQCKFLNRQYIYYSYNQWYTVVYSLVCCTWTAYMCSWASTLRYHPKLWSDVISVSYWKFKLSIPWSPSTIGLNTIFKWDFLRVYPAILAKKCRPSWR